jgi:hypothetical protein
MKAAAAALLISIIGANMATGDQPTETAGCNEALLESEFSISRAPKIVPQPARKQFIEKVIAEMRGGYGGTMVLEPHAHSHLDAADFVALYLREYSRPGQDPHSYDYRFERLLARLAGSKSVLDEPMLDWDIWRAFLLLENSRHTNDYFKDGDSEETRVMSFPNSARDLLWVYLDHNAKAILNDQSRLDWWITQLTRDLESTIGRPHRKWFLLQLLCAADPTRGELEKVPPKKAFASDGKTPLRQPHPLDPFLVIEDGSVAVPSQSLHLRKPCNKLRINKGLAFEFSGSGRTICHRRRSEPSCWSAPNGQ